MSASLETTVTLTLSELEAMLDARDAKFFQKLDDVMAELKPAKSLLVGTGEVANMLGVSTRTVQRLYDEGKLPKTVSKYGCNHKWNRAEIEREAESRKRGGRPRKAA